MVYCKSSTVKNIDKFDDWSSVHQISTLAFSLHEFFMKPAIKSFLKVLLVKVSYMNASFVKAFSIKIYRHAST